MTNSKSTKSDNFTKFYRKIYCPICKEYSVRVYDNDIECFNDCEITSKVDVNNFNGFFNREEIESLFIFNEKGRLENLIKLFRKPIIFGNISKRDGDRLNKIFEKKNYTEIDIDDLVINYLIKEGLDELPKNPTNYGYIINLIEDIHYFLLRACQDLSLFDIALEINKTKEDKPFYSARFFFYNVIESIWYAFERIVVYAGLKYGYEFKQKLERNGSYEIITSLEKRLEQNDMPPIYKEIAIYRKKSGNFIGEIRRDNTHNSSIHIQEINRRTSSNRNAKKLIMEKNANYFDGLYLKPKVNKTILAIEQLYCALEEIVKDFNENCDQFDNIQIPMRDEFEKITLFNIQINKKFDLKAIDFRKQAAFNNLIQLSKGDEKYNAEMQMLWDIFFRLEETQKCIIDVYRLEDNVFESYWSKTIEFNIVGFIDSRLFVYAGMSRIYAALDKFSQYYASSRGLDKKKIRYFKSLKSIDSSNSDPVLNKIHQILESEEYKGLSKFRNRIAHNLSAGVLYGDTGVKSENALIYYCIVKLINDCLDLLFEEAKLKLEHV